MTTEQATQRAIVAAVRAFVQRVEERASPRIEEWPGNAGVYYQDALYAELAALERAVAEGEPEPEGGSQEDG